MVTISTKIGLQNELLRSLKRILEKAKKSKHIVQRVIERNLPKIEEELEYETRKVFCIAMTIEYYGRDKLLNNEISCSMIIELISSHGIEFGDEADRSVVEEVLEGAIRLLNDEPY